MERIASSHHGLQDYYVAVLTTGDVRKKVWPKRLFEKTMICKFESIDVVIPIGYEELLTIQYGDYLKYPPIEERGVSHSDLIFNPDKPYSDFFI